MKPRAGRLAISCLAALLFLIALDAPAALAGLPPGFQDTELEFEGFIPGHQLEQPTTMRFAQNGKVFVAERSGEILVYDDISDTTPTVFADLRTQVFDLGDRGVLGMVLDPKFTEGRPYVYVLYTYDHVLGEPGGAPRWGARNLGGDPCPETNGGDDCLVSGRLVRLTAEGDHAATEIEKFVEGGEELEEGVPAETVLVEGWCQQFSSHSIGDLQFGPDEALYASGGEGASYTSADYGQFGEPTANPCGDPPAGTGGDEEPPTARGGALRSQNSQLLSGKVIRVSPDTGEGLPGNPLYESANQNERRIIAKGFRNPFRFTFDPRSDEVYVGNVGWGTYEEIDRFAPPEEGIPDQLYNSGWPCFEGPETNPAYAFLGLEVCEQVINTPGSTSPPFFYYKHGVPVTPEDPCRTEYGSAISGFDFYQGENFPAQYKGALFFSDPVRGCIYVMFPGEGGEPDPATTVPFLTNGGSYPGIDLQEGPEGNLYYVKLLGSGPEGDEGSIHQISYTSGNHPPIARLKVDHRFSAGDLIATFDATESTDADGEGLEYEWDPQADGTFEPKAPTGTKTLTFTDSVNHEIAMRVVDEQGATSVARIKVYPHDTPPEPEIAEPSESLKWLVGEAIHFSGSAHDVEESGEQLSAAQLSWTSRLYHCPSACHTHPLQEFLEVSSGEFVAPEHDYPSQIELILTATDSRGLSARKAIHLLPSTVVLELRTEPEGLQLSAGTMTQATPFLSTIIKGSKILLAAPETVTEGNTTYTWNDWSDGQARVHAVLAQADGVYTAKYTYPGEPPKKEPQTEVGPQETQPEPPSKPQTRLEKHPGIRSKRAVARFTFSASGEGARFRCKLDGGPYKRCSSPQVYRGLEPGRHVFRVVAANTSGADPTPAKFTWTIS